MIARTIVMYAAAIGAVIVTAGCSSSNTRAEAWHHGASARYDMETNELYRIYSYYPQQEVYRSEYQDRWFYRSEGDWTASRTLPRGMMLTTAPVIVELPSERPYDQHERVVDRHPSNAMLEARIALLEQAYRSDPSEGQNSGTIVSVPTEY